MVIFIHCRKLNSCRLLSRDELVSMLQKCYNILDNNELIEFNDTRQKIGEFILKFDNIEGTFSLME